MTRLWIYILGASEDPDHVRCVVPWQVDKDLIFFGPCMKRIRKRLREEFLAPSYSCSDVTDDLYMVGVNACNPEEVRKVVWAGKISQVMTFWEAHTHLNGDRFRKLRDHASTPLHVRPLFENGQLLGYKHVGQEHLKNQRWVSDLASTTYMVRVEGQRLVLEEGISAWNGFDLDCCMLLENLFFAKGRGIDFDDESLAILREEQPERSNEIDRYAIFGRTDEDKVNPRRGYGLPIRGNAADRFVDWIRKRSLEVADDQGDNDDVPPKTRCP